jgi:hypothetical protein
MESSDRDELVRQIREFLEPALVTLIALQIQEKSHQMSDDITYEFAVKCAEKQIAETSKLLGF